MKTVVLTCFHPGPYAELDKALEAVDETRGRVIVLACKQCFDVVIGVLRQT